MKTPWHHPDLAPLLRAALHAQNERGTPKSPDDMAATPALNALYAEIGKRVVFFAQKAASQSEVAHIAPKEDPPRPETTQLPLTRPEKTTPKTHTNAVTFTARSTAPDWCSTVIDVLHLIEAPTVIHAYTDVSVEAARLVWATLSIQSLDDEVPDAVLTGLFGLLSARCHHLNSQLDTTWVPDTVLRELLGRARQMNIEGLGAFSIPPKSIFGDWFEEALHWWDVVQHGLQSFLEEQP